MRQTAKDANGTAASSSRTPIGFGDWIKFAILIVAVVGLARIWGGDQEALRTHISDRGCHSSTEQIRAIVRDELERFGETWETKFLAAATITKAERETLRGRIERLERFHNVSRPRED